MDMPDIALTGETGHIKEILCYINPYQFLFVTADRHIMF